MKDVTRIVVTNLLGQEVMSVTDINTDKAFINVSDLIEGLYMVSFYNGNQVTTRKFMKE
jgi:hypothetical protein